MFLWVKGNSCWWRHNRSVFVPQWEGAGKSGYRGRWDGGWGTYQMIQISNFFSKRDLAEMKSPNIYVHFALRLVDTDLLDEAVGVLWADGTIVEIVGDDDEEDVEEIPQLVVRLGMERAFFQRKILISPDPIVTKEQLLVEIETIERSSNVLTA
jgi:hypothetical protein